MQKVNKQKALIFGASGHAKVVIDILEKSETIEILGLLDSYKQIGGETLGYKILGTEEIIPKLMERYPDCKLIIAIGDNWKRYQKMKRILEIAPKIMFLSAIHPHAQIGKSVSIGRGVVIMAGVVINSDAFIEDFCIINTKASVGHDGKLQKFSSLAPNVTLGGNVNVGKYSAISMSSTVIQGVKIGYHALVGAGSLITEDCGNHSVFFGSPAKEIRKREIGESYF